MDGVCEQRDRPGENHQDGLEQCGHPEGDETDFDGPDALGAGL